MGVKAAPKRMRAQGAGAKALQAQEAGAKGPQMGPLPQEVCTPQLVSTGQIELGGDMGSLSTHSTRRREGGSAAAGRL